ncbi:saccharopine dehydrogenase C-terminal domain-containing protein [Kangiella koreensis]|uniref:Saccharopine dehydrogenase (NADP(+), L-glutamate-forming) n=1 Tax=Kangiella koreensis (strain DSM 16069 / JCM 12317 / KCTC 12182 / SW-125) TaxID=523791 RepID=C7RCP0_KANKD|nr:saccharopine dehydrogenase C-terminal domain-containing protein [Kangiella koreensis]ACV27032.1 Saccharopine dehydrogenase (NADP(+), L-glutamate- forming) [Kangiella koreensis DSM 16069]
MAKFLVFGAGFVAEPLVEYLLRRSDNTVTVVSHILEEAQALANKFPGVDAVQADVTNQAQIEPLIADYDLVVSLVPATLHAVIAKAAIAQGKNMVTASYESPAMRELKQDALDAGVTILNEIGLDPGIDHLSAMKIIDQAHADNEKVISFVSWCGGLPSPEANDNPLGYKFSWAPKGVLLALLNDALFLHNGKVERVVAKELLKWAKPLQANGLNLEGYPNRDSTGYQEIYGIPEAENIIRGTFRYSGFCEIIQAAKDLSLLDAESEVPTGNTIWTDYVCQINGVDNFDALKTRVSESAWRGLGWIGCFSEKATGDFAGPIDAFCNLLVQKLNYHEDQVDMVLLQHKFEIEKADGSRYHIASTLQEFGQVGGYSAMSKTVGYPAAIACQLIADGIIDRKGIILPMTKDIYLPILELLEKEGVTCEEELREYKPEFLSELAS